MPKFKITVFPCTVQAVGNPQIMITNRLGVIEVDCAMNELQDVMRSKSDEFKSPYTDSPSLFMSADPVDRKPIGYKAFEAKGLNERVIDRQTKTS